MGQLVESLADPGLGNVPPLAVQAVPEDFPQADRMTAIQNQVLERFEERRAATGRLPNLQAEDFNVRVPAGGTPEQYLAMLVPGVRNRLFTAGAPLRRSGRIKLAEWLNMDEAHQNDPTYWPSLPIITERDHGGYVPVVTADANTPFGIRWRLKANEAQSRINRLHRDDIAPLPYAAAFTGQAFPDRIPRYQEFLRSFDRIAGAIGADDSFTLNPATFDGFYDATMMLRPFVEGVITPLQNLIRLNAQQFPRPAADVVDPYIADDHLGFIAERFLPKGVRVTRETVNHFANLVHRDAEATMALQRLFDLNDIFIAAAVTNNESTARLRGQLERIGQESGTGWLSGMDLATIAHETRQEIAQRLREHPSLALSVLQRPAWLAERANEAHRLLANNEVLDTRPLTDEDIARYRRTHDVGLDALLTVQDLYPQLRAEQYRPPASRDVLARRRQIVNATHENEPVQQVVSPEMVFGGDAPIRGEAVDPAQLDALQRANALEMERLRGQYEAAAQQLQQGWEQERAGFEQRLQAVQGDARAALEQELAARDAAFARERDGLLAQANAQAAELDEIRAALEQAQANAGEAGRLRADLDDAQENLRRAEEHIGDAERHREEVAVERDEARARVDELEAELERRPLDVMDANQFRDPNGVAWQNLRPEEREALEAALAEQWQQPIDVPRFLAVEHTIDEAYGRLQAAVDDALRAENPDAAPYEAAFEAGRNLFTLLAQLQLDAGARQAVKLALGAWAPRDVQQMVHEDLEAARQLREANAENLQAAQDLEAVERAVADRYERSFIGHLQDILQLNDEVEGEVDDNRIQHALTELARDYHARRGARRIADQAHREGLGEPQFQASELFDDEHPELRAEADVRDGWDDAASAFVSALHEEDRRRHHEERERRDNVVAMNPNIEALLAALAVANRTPLITPGAMPAVKRSSPVSVRQPTHGRRARKKKARRREVGPMPTMTVDRRTSHVTLSPGSDFIRSLRRQR